MKRILLLVLATLLAGGFIYLAVTEAIDVKKKQKLDTIQIESKELEVNKLELDLKQLNTELKTQLKKKDLDQKEIERLQTEIKDRQEREKALERELQAKLERKAQEKQKLATAARRATGTQSASAATVSTGNSARAFIFQKESGNRLNAVNSGGCYGLGQDCNGTLASACPNWRTDRPCQEAFWESYMQRRYGSWEKARAHWLARVPINGRDVGHWW